jgi:hypothetical protein
MAMVVTLVAPLGTSAAVLGNTVSWSGEAYAGYDPFYDQNVVAFLEGSSAKLTWVDFNNSGSDITPVEAWLQFDWANGRYSAATVPSTVVENMPGTFSIGFTTPSAASAGATPHGYIFGAAYQSPELDYQALRTKWAQPAGAINGVNLVYTLPGGNLPVAEGSLEVYLKGPSPATAYTVQTIGTHYSFNWWTGTITFNTPPAFGSDVRVNYNHYDKLNPYGDGVRDTWYLANDRTPVKDGSWTFYVKDDGALTVTALASTAYTFDRFWGQVALTTPLEPWQQLLARYEWYIRFPWYDSSSVGYTFVVVTQDQADYTSLWRRYTEISDTEDVDGWISASAQLLYSQAEAARAKAEIEYREGQFAAARADMQTAVDRLNASIAAAIAFMTSAQEMRLASDNAQLNLAVAEVGQIQAENALIPKEGTYLDAQTASLNAQTARINALTEAEKGALKASNSREKSYGTFVILMGVFFILVGAAVLLLAVGMFLKWRKPAAGGST